MREKCSKCGDKIFKIIDGNVICRQNHGMGVLQKQKQEVEDEFNVHT